MRGKEKRSKYTVYEAGQFESVDGQDGTPPKPVPPKGANPVPRPRIAPATQTTNSPAQRKKSAKYTVYEGAELASNDQASGAEGQRRVPNRTVSAATAASSQQQPASKKRRRPGRRRILKLAFKAAFAWVLLSGVLFMLSAQLQQQHGDFDGVLGGGGSPFTPSNVLLLGTDKRPNKKWNEPGSEGQGRGRADTIMMLRTGGGTNNKLAVPRDTVVNLPNAGRQKINASYALAGPTGTINAVRNLTGIKANHFATVSFENFPILIDAMGGITYKGGCLNADVTGGANDPGDGVTIGKAKKAGGVSFRLKANKRYHLNGEAALALSRVRKNSCAAAENDIQRSQRQQQILAAIKRRIMSPIGFARLPWIAWNAPKAVKTDMSGPTLLGIAIGMLVPGKGNQHVLKPSTTEQLPDGGIGLQISDAEIKSAAQKFR